ncbi:MAG: alpha-amylase [Roseburia sp.]|nr:alpha-amylase [Roseburia sp.]
MDKTEKLFQYKPGDNLPFGVTKVADGVQFAVSIPHGRECYLNLYRTGQKRPVCRIHLTREFRRGCVYFVKITGCPEIQNNKSVADILSQGYEYMYEVDGKEFVDPYAAVIHGRERWGKRVGKACVRGGISLEEFDWKDDSPLGTPFSDMILYQLHVRGFTKHASSKVEHRGSFAGLMEKIPYLKDLGINAVLLLPCYEFDEIQAVQKPHGIPAGEVSAVRTAEDEAKQKSTVSKNDQVKLNYWGYGQSETYYCAPKAAYAADPHRAGLEFKALVRSLHQAGIEVLLDIYFMPGTNVCLMEDCLRNWVLEYHIDGFRVNQEVMPTQMLVSDPVLSGVKLLTDYWNRELIAGAYGESGTFAEYNEGFMNCARRYLKSDEGQVEGFAGLFRRGSDNLASINFMTHVNGFTMTDLVSYDVKHNEQNGEGNQDGTEYNYSWNCGVEGKSRKKFIQARRMCQIRNAFAMMLLAQGTPMLLAGDEFGNTQEGNNNPYCQDNEITWLDWRMTSAKTEILEYVKKLIAFRRKHPVLHQGRELYMFDSLSCGMPDVSIHGTQAWKADFSYYSRMLAVLLYGDYQKKEDGGVDDSLYIIFNMYWESKSFDLPNLPGEKEWYPAIETYGNTFSEVPVPVRRKKRRRKPSLESQKKTIVPPRSIVVFVGR